MAATLACLIGAAAPQPPTQPPTIGPGNGEASAELPGATLRVFTYRPAGCDPRMVLLVFHGVGRNPDAYRDHARPLADATCAIVVAPLFDKDRFPRDLYQYGGVANGGTVSAPGGRTVDLVAPLVAWGHLAAGGRDLPIVLVGHSAGSQFLGRVAAFAPAAAPPAVARMVIANPSTWVWPSTTIAEPFGFGGMATPDASEAALRAYLALPLEVVLGTADTKSRNLATGPEAMAQGPTRYRRGLNAFAAAQQTASSHGWAFGWTLNEVPGVGHDATAMFAAPETLAAVRGDPASRVRAPNP